MNNENYHASKENLSPSNGVGKNQLSTLMGVYIPCMLSILGAILFLRLSWAVGQAGFFGVLGIFLLSGTAVLLTSLSISAISTNGSMGGGGAYFMISRSIGPEFGGAVGIIFYFANAFGTTFYLVAFADNVVDTFLPEKGKWFKIMIASIALFMTLVAAYIGADFFSKLNVGILFCIGLAISAAVLTLIFGFSCKNDRFPGLNYETLTDNLYANYGPIINDADGTVTEENNSFFRVFGIVFPAMTGIMAGANLSGDLKDPGRSIGKGTISAIFSSLVIYIGLAFFIAWSIEGEYLRTEKQALIQVNCWSGGKYIIVVGIWCSTLSSGLGALTGAARVLQAFCVDFSQIGESNSKFGKKLVTMLRFFSYGTTDKNEPRRAVILTWAIAQSLLLLGSLDLLASIITNCFLLTYFFTNFACFVLRVSGAPNFRPKFKYFSWHTALLGALLNIVIMFLASPIFATISIILMSFVFLLILYSAPEVPWGDISQALIFHQVRKYLLRLDERKTHPKFWRPSVLLLIDDPVKSLTLIDFCNNLKKGGMYVLGDVLKGDLQSTGSSCHLLQDEWGHFIRNCSVKAFTEVVLAPTYRSGAQTLMISAGLGGLKPNTVVIPFNYKKKFVNSAELDRQESARSEIDTSVTSLQKIADIHGKVNSEAIPTVDEFVGIIKDALFLKMNLLVACNFHLLDKDLIVSRVKYGQNSKRLKKKYQDPLYIDIWFTNELDLEDLKYYTGNLSLMMQLAFGLNRTDIWQECTKLRIVNLVNETSTEALEQHHSKMKDLLDEARLEAKILVLQKNMEQNQTFVQSTNESIQKNMEKTSVIFLNLPFPPEYDEAKSKQYVNDIETLTDGLPPTVLTLSGATGPVIATAI